MGTLARHRNNFDLIRLFAASNVMLLHTLGYFGYFVGPRGITQTVMEALPGVPIFFVVSGFLVTASFQRSSSLFSYLRNRFLRIYPGLWVCFALSLLSVVLARYPLPLGFKFAMWIVAQVTVAQFVTPSFLYGYGTGALNGSLWTIPVELQFYLLLPPLVRFVPRWVIFPLIAIFAVVNQFPKPDVHLLGLTIPVLLPSYLYMFLLGVGLQLYEERLRRFYEGKFVLWLAVYALACVLASRIGLKVGGNDPNPWLMLLLAMLVLSAAYSWGSLSDRLLKGNDLSYGIYIYHVVIINFLIHTRHGGALVAIVATYVAAYLSWKLVESPMLRKKKPAPPAMREPVPVAVASGEPAPSSEAPLAAPRRP